MKREGGGWAGLELQGGIARRKEPAKVEAVPLILRVCCPLRSPDKQRWASGPCFHK